MFRIEGRAVLVTGVTGFVGPHVVRALHARGARVHGLANEPAPPSLPMVSWHGADLRDPQSLSAAIADARPDALIHLAGQSSAARSFEQPAETFEANALGTWRLLEATRREAPGARVLVVGSSEAYGPQPEGSRVSESAPFRPVSPYALSKAVADAYAEMAATVHGLDVVRARAFSHTGPGQRPPFVIPSWAEQIAAIEAGRAEPVLRVGDVQVTRDLSDVRDVALGYLALLERAPKGSAYNLCRGVGVRLDDVVRTLAGWARTPVRVEVEAGRLRPADVRYLVGDPGAAERDLGWRVRIDLDRTLADVLTEWRGSIRPGGAKEKGVRPD